MTKLFVDFRNERDLEAPPPPLHTVEASVP